MLHSVVNCAVPIKVVDFFKFKHMEFTDVGFIPDQKTLIPSQLTRTLMRHATPSKIRKIATKSMLTE